MIPLATWLRERSWHWIAHKMNSNMARVANYSTGRHHRCQQDRFYGHLSRLPSPKHRGLSFSPKRILSAIWRSFGSTGSPGALLPPILLSSPLHILRGRQGVSGCHCRIHDNYYYYYYYLTWNGTTPMHNMAKRGVGYCTISTTRGINTQSEFNIRLLGVFGLMYDALVRVR